MTCKLTKILVFIGVLTVILLNVNVVSFYECCADAVLVFRVAQLRQSCLKHSDWLRIF